MLGWRLLLSAVLIPGFACLFYLDQKSGPAAPVLFAVAMLLAMRAAWELVELFRARTFEPSFPQTAILSCLVVASAWLDHIGPAVAISRTQNLSAGILAYSFAVLWLFASNAARYHGPGRRMETLGAELIVVSYVGVLLYATSQLRWVAGHRAGSLVLGSLIIAVKCGDIGAYTLGRLFGRRKMAPQLSPGKTWVGALGGLLASAAGAWAWLHWAPSLFDPAWQPCSVFWSIVYGAVVGIAGIVGDLCESLVKRDLGKKDAATLMPGFGGLLDLVDSVLYAGPVAYVLWRMLPLATWEQ